MNRGQGESQHISASLRSRLHGLDGAVDGDLHHGLRNDDLHGDLSPLNDLDAKRADPIVLLKGHVISNHSLHSPPHSSCAHHEPINQSFAIPKTGKIWRPVKHLVRELGACYQLARLQLFAFRSGMIGAIGQVSFAASKYRRLPTPAEQVVG